MSSSRLNDLQLAKSNPNQLPMDLKTKRILEETAILVAKHGLSFERKLLADNVDNEIYDFLKRSDHLYHAFYRNKITEYRNARKQEIQPPYASATEPPSGDLHLFMCPEGIIHKDFGVIKLTAQFVARYGMPFWWNLVNNVTMNPNPLFEFIKTTDIKFNLLLRLVDAYEKVLKPYQKPFWESNPGVCKETVLEGYFYLVQGEKFAEEKVEMATIDLHAFVSGLDFLASREVGELSAPGYLSTQMWSGVPDAFSATDDNAPLNVHHLGRGMDESIEELRYYPFTYPEEITRKQLSVIKLTAQFSAQYGPDFTKGLNQKLIIKPQLLFEFLNSTDDSYHHFFNRLIFGYARVMICPIHWHMPGAVTETIFDGFFSLLQEKMKEEDVEISISDLHAFVGGLDYFAKRTDEELFSPGYAAVIPPLGPKFYRQMRMREKSLSSLSPLLKRDR